MLVAPGGYFEGYLPIFQGKNTSPHICAVSHNYVNEYLSKMGWKWLNP